MNKNILIDYHHSGLFSSFLYTLESRLGYSVFRPIGESWFTSGNWRINKQKDTIQQYLGTVGYKPLDGTPSLNNVMWVEDEVYYSKDPNTGQVHKAITYEKFLQMKWFAVIASIPQHIEPYKKMAKMSDSKMIFQEGNNFHLSDKSYPNLMSSTVPRSTKCHSVFYAQEFDTRIFSYTEPQEVVGKPQIHNYMNVLYNYPEAFNLFMALEKAMPDYEFKMYGSQNRDGCITGIDNLAAEMRKCRWAFHVKPGGDGYGHVVHNLFAMGKPMITVKRYYEGHAAGRLMDDKACIIADGLPVEQLADIIRNREARHDEISKIAYKRFADNINFEDDAKRIQKFLEELT